MYPHACLFSTSHSPCVALCFLSTTRTQTHTIAHVCSTVQKIAIITAYISPQKLLSVCAVACVWVCDFLCEKRLGASGLCSVDHWVLKKNDVKKATLYLWLDRYPPVDRYTVIMWLSGVAAGRSLSREPVFPCIRESLLVYLSPPQRPHCTSRHQQDKTRCHIYGAVSSTLMPERLTTGCLDFAAEVNDSTSLYVTPEPTAWWCFDYCHSPIRRNWNCYIRGRVCFIMTSLSLLVCFKSSLILCYCLLCMSLPVLCSKVWVSRGERQDHFSPKNIYSGP